jgi:hypothetical protein
VSAEKSLPARPHLERYRKQSKDLVKHNRASLGTVVCDLLTEHEAIAEARAALTQGPFLEGVAQRASRWFRAYLPSGGQQP